MATVNDEESSKNEKAMDASKESLLAAYGNLLDAQAHFREAEEAARQALLQT